ncbi:MAG TPA: TonB family protein [Polyangiaceae bacterium]|nr:TonB family protein [Polyangiaceae bacterium]
MRGGAARREPKWSWLLSIAQHAGLAWIGTRGASLVSAAYALTPRELPVPDLEVVPVAAAPALVSEPVAAPAPPTAVASAAPRPRAARSAPVAVREIAKEREKAADPAVLAAPAGTPRFAMAVPVAARAGESSHPAPASATAAPGVSGDERNGTASSAPIEAVLADTPARLLEGEAPSYTRAAEAAGIEAEVPLEIVVDASGRVRSARALAHVGYGLDEAALQGISKYRFSPALRRRAAVAVRMQWRMRFQLR